MPVHKDTQSNCIANVRSSNAFAVVNVHAKQSSIRALLIAFVFAAACLSVCDKVFADTPSNQGPSDKFIEKGISALERKDVPGAFRAFQKALDAKHVDAGFYLARMMELGIGVKVDLKKALRLHRYAAEQGSGKSLNRLGVLLVNAGKGRNFLKHARILFCRSANRNHPDGLYNCARMKQTGKGGPKDLVGAQKLYQKAIARGHIASHVVLAQMCQRGKPNLCNSVKVIELFEAAAERGNPIALFELGSRYEVGDHVKPDIERAHLYYTIAAARTHQGALQAMRRLENSMSKEQISSSNAAALLWRAKTDP